MVSGIQEILQPLPDCTDGPLFRKKYSIVGCLACQWPLLAPNAPSHLPPCPVLHNLSPSTVECKEG
jgi:hypothetical protein